MNSANCLPIEIPRDRHGTFEPQLIPKHQTRWTGFDDKILSLYARGMTVREIQSHLEEMYGTEVSPTLISSVTDAVIDEVKAWQSRPLDAIYALFCAGVRANTTQYEWRAGLRMITAGQQAALLAELTRLGQENAKPGLTIAA